MKIELTAEQAQIAAEALEHWAESIRDTIGEVDAEERAGMLEEHDLAAGAMRAICAEAELAPYRSAVASLIDAGHEIEDLRQGGVEHVLIWLNIDDPTEHHERLACAALDAGV